MSRFVLPLTCWFAVLLSGCRSSAPPLEIPEGENPSRWAKAMAAFAHEDEVSPNAPGGVVFVGSSSIRLWKTLEPDMAPVRIIQRGFGGAKLFDAIYWSELLVSKHRPELVVVFCGTNDLVGDDAKTAVEVRDLFRRFVARLRWFDDDLPICHIAITPTLARERWIERVHEANRLIRADCEADPNLEFIDPTPDLLDANGRPDPKWFVRDRLHLNARGYEVWTRLIRPVVLRRFRS